MAHAFLSHAVGQSLKMRTYRVENLPRKPDATRNIEDGSHVLHRRSGASAACFFGHAGKLMQIATESALSQTGKFGKKLTNNFIILCELLHGACVRLRHTKLSLKTLAPQAGF
jgi:uncharacterized protein involved in propanediol utilization